MRTWKVWDLDWKNYFSMIRNLTLREVNLITSLEGAKRSALEACKNEESLFSKGLESFPKRFGYKVKLVSKLPIFFDKVKTFEMIFEK
jgi:hypothetical protein